MQSKGNELMRKAIAAAETKWPATTVRMTPLEQIIPYGKNPRQHSPEQIELIAKSMIEDGVTSPILVDEDGVIIYGHGRRMAAEKNGFTQYPVIVAKGWTEQQKRAYRIKDNSLALLSTWSTDLLRVELGELSSAGYDMPLLGFDDVQLVQFMSVPSGADPEVTPEPPVKPVSRTGDLWIMGKHRLLCGDSTKSDDVDRVLGGKNPHLMVTDPPYGVDYDPGWRDDRASKSPTMGNRKDTAKGSVSNDDRADWREVFALFGGDVAYVWCASLTNDAAIGGLEAIGLLRRSLIIWSKTHIAVGRGDYQWQHELCWYAVRKGRTGHWAGDRKQATVWNIDKPQKSETGHSTQKPIECMRRPIQNNSKPGDYVYEPFAGSGTTIIAAEMMNRYALAIELAPNYVDVCVERWMTFAKGDAILDGDGRTFAQIKAARMKKAPSTKPGAKAAKRGQTAAVPK